MKAYKGFTKEMMCRGFKFEDGETYHENKAELCKCGFHACEYPLDCFGYYSPSDSVFHSVDLTEVDKTRKEDTKISGKTIKIGARLDIMGIVKASIEYITSRTDKNNSATGNWSANSATGNRSANSATGDGSANSATGDWSANSATGNWSDNSATGYGSANVSTGNNAKNHAGNGSVSVGWGKDNICKGDIGAYIVIVERGEWDGEKYPQIGEPKLGKIDGEILKADTWYTLKNGEFIEVTED